MLSTFSAENPSNLATVEQTATASKAYAVGDYLVYQGQLYRVISAISQGGTIYPRAAGATTGGNCVSTKAAPILIEQTATVDITIQQGTLYRSSGGAVTIDLSGYGLTSAPKYFIDVESANIRVLFATPSGTATSSAIPLCVWATESMQSATVKIKVLLF